MVLAVDPAEATLAEGLGELLLAHMAHDGVRMVGKEEIQAALGHDDAGSLGCLATPSCLGQLATQLGLEELVAVTFARRGEGFSFDLARFELRSGERRADVHREVAAAEVGSLAEAMVAALETSTEAPTPRPARLTLAVEPSNAHVVLDGVAVEVDGPLSVTAGTHRLRVEAEGYVAVERTLELDEGERRDVDVALAAVPPPSPPFDPRPVRERPDPFGPVAWVAGGVTVVSAGVALAFGLRSQREVETGVTRAEALSQVSSRRREARIANVGLAVGAVALVGAAVSGVLAWRGRRTRVGLEPLARGAQLSLEVSR